MLDRCWLGLLTITYIASGIVLQSGYRKAEDTVVRQQLKWLRNGILFGFAPFGILYAAPYVIGTYVLDYPYLNYAVLTLPLIPLTIAYAIVRYRLMDVDVIFRRGYAYTLATLCVLAAFYAIVLGVSRLVQVSFKDMSSTNLVIVMLIATFLFQPIRNWIQERLDRYFYRDRYNYRRTLIEFARELNSGFRTGSHAANRCRQADADAVDPARGLLSGGRCTWRDRGGSRTHTSENAAGEINGSFASRWARARGRWNRENRWISVFLAGRKKGHTCSSNEPATTWT